MRLSEYVEAGKGTDPTWAKLDQLQVVAQNHDLLVRATGMYTGDGGGTVVFVEVSE